MADIVWQTGNRAFDAAVVAAALVQQTSEAAAFVAATGTSVRTAPIPPANFATYKQAIIAAETAYLAAVQAAALASQPGNVAQPAVQCPNVLTELSSSTLTTGI